MEAGLGLGSLTGLGKKQGSNLKKVGKEESLGHTIF